MMIIIIINGGKKQDRAEGLVHSLFTVANFDIIHPIITHTHDIHSTSV